jgi:hypothetical protein
VQHQLCGAPLDSRQRNFRQQRNWIVITLPPRHGIQIAKQRDRIVIPAPPQVARQGPQALLHRSNEAIQASRFTYNWRHLRRRGYEHANFGLTKLAGLGRLHDQYALQNTSVDQRHAEKSLVPVLTGLTKIFKSRMLLCVL